jgi:hypothetical protein
VLPAVPSTTVPPGFSLERNVSHHTRTTDTGMYAQAEFLRIRDEAERSTVLYAPARVLELGLAVDVAARALRDRLQVYLYPSSAVVQASRTSARTSGVFPIAPVRPVTGLEVKLRASALVGALSERSMLLWRAEGGRQVQMTKHPCQIHVARRRRHPARVLTRCRPANRLQRKKDDASTTSIHMGLLASAARDRVPPRRR